MWVGRNDDIYIVFNHWARRSWARRQWFKLIWVKLIIVGGLLYGGHRSVSLLQQPILGLHIASKISNQVAHTSTPVASLFDLLGCADVRHMATFTASKTIWGLFFE